MFEGERATQTPQDGMSRIGAIALRDRLGVAREDEQLGGEGIEVISVASVLASLKSS